jgi:ribosomal protein L10
MHKNIFLCFLYLFMNAKTTVAIDIELRKRLKKIGVLLDLSQNAVIERAVDLLEKNIMANNNSIPEKRSASTKKTVDEILEQASAIVCAQDPEHKKIQESLSQGAITIDDVIVNSWNSGLDLE